MLTKLDHIVLLCADIHAAVTAYAAVFGRDPDWRRHDPASGIHTALFRVDNTGLEIMAADSDGPSHNRFTEILEGRDGMLTSLAFLTDDPDRTQHILTRRGLGPTDMAANDRRDADADPARPWDRMRLDDDACHGIKTFVLGRVDNTPRPMMNDTDVVYALDHIVINTPNPTRARAHYGGRLGLDLRLAHTIEAFHTEFLFFKIGTLVFEIIHRTDKDHDPQDPDMIWGLTWRVNDISAARTRLLRHGVEVSDIRKGRKPGTEVMTLRSHTVGVPTLLLAQSPIKL